MGNTASSSAKCGVCAVTDSSRSSVVPGCCKQSYHLECLQSHLSNGNTTCLKCHQIFPGSILDLHAATAVATAQQQQSPVVQAQAIPQQQQQMMQHVPPPPPPAQLIPPVRHSSVGAPVDKELLLEDTVEEWVPPPVTNESSHNVEINVECSPELPEVPLTSKAGFNTVVSVSASSAMDIDSFDLSPPMDIVCVLDVSGSMGCGNKLDNLKLAVKFMREELKDSDRMSIITFERSARRVHGLRKMNSDNKLRTEHCINELRPGGGTRILTGLKEACDVLQARQTKNPISSVFLLTDGIDASDLREKKQTAKKIKELGASLFIYGFGNDHDSLHLKTIADAGEGSFTFIEKSDMVIDAFGGALGAEKSIFAQDLCLTVKPCSGVSVSNVDSGNYRHSLSTSDVSIRFPNLMQGEQRDVLIVLDLAEVSDPMEKQSILTTSLTYLPLLPNRDDGSSNRITLTGDDCVISRKKSVVPGLQRNANVDVQINRSLLNKATDTSLALADKGDYEKARTNLKTAIDTMKTSSSWLHNDTKAVAYVSELESTLSGIQDEDVYRYKGGRSMVSEMQDNIRSQRCTYTKEGRSNVMQNNASLGSQERYKAKKSSFFGK